MVMPASFSRWMEKGGFRFARLEISGIDNGTVLEKNRPEMAEEEICIFHRDVVSGDAYFDHLHRRVEVALRERKPLPIVRFADGEFAFYAGSMECNGLYRQAESTEHIRASLPYHIDALRRLSLVGLLAPLFFRGNIVPRRRALKDLLRGRKPFSAATFLDFLLGSGIVVDATNYLPFYTVYAWLSSPHFACLVDGRRICILNAGWDAEACRRWFGSRQSEPHLTFVDIPDEYVATRWPSLKNTILARIPANTDLCLAGAGVGALPLCVDVAELLSITAIDAGHVLNMMNDRLDKSNGDRLYTLWKTP